MNNFKLVTNGYIRNNVSDDEFVTLTRVLKLIPESKLDDMSPENRVYLAEEVLQVKDKLIGPDFVGWVNANYDNGRAPLSNLMLSLVKHLNGKLGVQNLISMISVEESRLSCFLPTNIKINKPVGLKAGTGIKLLEDGFKLNDNDIYRLISSIGPLNLTRILLLLSGGKHNE